MSVVGADRKGDGLAEPEHLDGPFLSCPDPFGNHPDQVGQD